MRTYYQGPDVVITRDVLVIQSRRLTYPIARLRNVHIVRGDLHPTRVAMTRVAYGAAVVAAASWPFLQSAEVVMAALALVVAPAAGAAACRRLCPQLLELRATYGDLDVLLYSSTNPTTFGQVTRALTRALEATLQM